MIDLCCATLQNLAQSAPFSRGLLAGCGKVDIWSKYWGIVRILGKLLTAANAGNKPQTAELLSESRPLHRAHEAQGDGGGDRLSLVLPCSRLAGAADRVSRHYPRVRRSPAAAGGDRPILQPRECWPERARHRPGNSSAR